MTPTLPTRVLLAATLALAGTWPAGTLRATSKTALIENAEIAVTISLDSGAITQVVRKKGGTGYLNPAATPEVLRMRIPLDDWDGHAMVGSHADWHVARPATPEALTLTAKRYADTSGREPLIVEIHYRVEGANLVAQLNVTNSGSRVVDGIDFPVLDVAAASDDTESVVTASGPAALRDMFSTNTVRTQHDPFERLDPEDPRGWIYDDPAFGAKAFGYPSGFALHTAWLQYRADDLGVGWDLRDRAFQSQHLIIERRLQRDRVSIAANRQHYELSWRWHPRIEPGHSWQSPEAYLRFDTADWHPIAKQHREWLASWITRPQVATEFRRSIGWLSRGLTSFDQIPDIARSGVGIGAPYLVLYGWYGGGMNGLSYDFFPQSMLGGAASLRENLAKARSIGAYPLAWYNGTTTAETTREHLEQAHGWVVVSRDGGLVVDGRWSLFDPDRPPTTDDTTVLLNYDMGTQAAAFNVENVRRLIDDYGFSGFEMDQGAKNYLAYAIDGRASRPELRYTEGVRAFYEGARDIVKRRDPQGVILGEGVSDFMNQYVDSTWTFEGGSVDIATTTYVRYSLPWVTLPAGVFTADPGYANRAFLMNSPLDIFLDVDAHPEFREHLRRLHRLKQAVHPYLYDGDFSDEEGFVLSADSAAVLAKSYLGGNGRVAVVVINESDAPHAATIAIERATGGPVTAYRLDGTVATLPPASADIRLELGAHDVYVLVAERGGAR